MRRTSGLLAASVVVMAGIAPAGGQAPVADAGLRQDARAGAVPPPWVYTVNTPPSPGQAAPAPAPGAAPELLEVPGSAVRLTRAQLGDLFNPPDWHPDSHPPPPEVVAHGRRPDVRACGYCHYPNGQGRPENSSLAGLPADYIVQQMADMRAGKRRSADPNMRPPAAMLAIARASTVDEDRSAAAYFASFPFRRWIRVVETATVPVMRVAGGVPVPVPGAGQEPIAGRIIETPENVVQAERRDSASGFVALVPVGAIARGRTLAAGGDGRAACSVCHGDGLKGLGAVPPLAGRSPSYAVRQLFDLQHGVRRGPWAPLMASTVAPLTLDDMVALAAYAASLAP
ncbi:MAG: cytochrome c [Vicinamibacterales bacterium]